MGQKGTIQAVQKCFTQLEGELSQYQVDKVLQMFPSEQRICTVFNVHKTTVKSWVVGKNKPNGRNKMAFNFMLNMSEQRVNDL